MGMKLPFHKGGQKSTVEAEDCLLVRPSRCVSKVVRGRLGSCPSSRIACLLLVCGRLALRRYVRVKDLRTTKHPCPSRLDHDLPS